MLGEADYFWGVFKGSLITYQITIGMNQFSIIQVHEWKQVLKITYRDHSSAIMLPHNLHRQLNLIE